MIRQTLEQTRHRHDARRKEFTPLYLKPVGEQIRFYLDRIAFEMGELQLPDWRIGPNPEQYTAMCRVRINNYRIEIDALRREEVSNVR